MFFGGCAYFLDALPCRAMDNVKRKRGRPATGRRPKVSFVIDATDLEQLRALADIRHCDVAAVLRQAVAEYLRESDA